MRRNDQRNLINMYTELRPVSSVALIGTGIIAMFAGAFPIGIAIILNGVAFGVMSSPPYVVKHKATIHGHRRNNRSY